MTVWYLQLITAGQCTKEDLIYKALKVSVARENRYCKKVEQRFLEELNQKKPKTLDGVERIWYDGNSRSHDHYDDSRYHCLNLHSVFQKGTIEFRLFSGTLHAGRIKAYIQFSLAIGAQALNQTCASRRKTQTTNDPWPIFAENKTVTEDTIQISYDFLEESSGIFANWKR